MREGRRAAWVRWIAAMFGVVLFVFAVGPLTSRAADEGSMTQQAGEAISGSAQAVEQGLATLQERISESRLVNRTRDENIAFVLMGVLVASVVGLFSKIRCSGMGILGRLGLGLGGAFLGGMLVRVADLDFGWGSVSMGYEELLFSLLGAVVLVAVSRFVQYQMKKKPSSES
jgi:uncharacterized membrane protein YeaQ/YmgE (transglycosylase-associated protein family)